MIVNFKKSDVLINVFFSAVSETVEGKISKKLKKLLKKLYVKELRDDVLAIADKKLSLEISVSLYIFNVSRIR